MASEEKRKILSFSLPSQLIDSLDKFSEKVNMNRSAAICYLLSRALMVETHDPDFIRSESMRISQYAFSVGFGNSVTEKDADGNVKK